MLEKRRPVADRWYEIRKRSCTELLKYHSTSEKKKKFPLPSENKVKSFGILDVFLSTLQNMAYPRLKAKCVLLNPSISVASICKAKHQKPHPAGKRSPQTLFHSRHTHSDTAFTAF